MSRDAVVQELQDLLSAEDPRTIAEMKAADEYREGTITGTTQHTDGGWTVEWTDDDPGTFGCGFNADRNPNGIVPEVGQTIRMYGRGFGYEFHGLDIDGREVFWRTPFERVADRVTWLADYDRRKRERFEQDQAKLDADYAALSEPLKERIARFRAESPSFRVDSESYELFVCVEADKIAAHLRSRVEAGEDPRAVVKEFYDLPFDRQKADAGVDNGHSGNTFGGACAMARALLSGEAV